MSKTITVGAVTAIAACAIARANGHPEPEIYGEIVAANLPGNVAAIELAMPTAPQAEQPPVDNDHVEPGAEQFDAGSIAQAIAKAADDHASAEA